MISEHTSLNFDIELDYSCTLDFSEEHGVVFTAYILGYGDDEPQEVEVKLSETRAEFSVGDVRLTTKLIDGTFPEYKRVIPKGNDKIISVSVNLLSAAVDRVSTIASDKSRAIKLNIENNQLVLSATNPDASSATESLEISYDGDSIDIGFNAKYLMDILTQIKGETIAIELIDSGSPSLLRDPEDEANIFVLMPM